jgi:nicotinamidase-related amidase
VSDARRALIVVDAQVEYVTGAVPIEFPDVNSSLRQIALAVDAAVDAGVPLVLVQHDAPAGSPVFDVGSATWQLDPVVAERDHLAVTTLHKTFPSAFTGTGLEERLRELGVDTVTVSGYLTQNCVQSTVIHAAHLGFAAELLSDASGAISLANEAGTVDARTVHESVCTVLQSNFAAVMTTDRWIDVLSGQGAPVRSNILASQATARELREREPEAGGSSPR